MAEKFDEERHRDERGQHIGGRLRAHDAPQPEQPGQHQQHRDEAGAAAQRRQEGGAPRKADALEQHIGAHRQREDDERGALDAQRRHADGDDVGVIAQKRHDGPREEGPAGREQHHDGGADAQRDKEGAAHAGIDPRAVVVGRDGLEPLPDAQPHAEQEVGHAGHDAHRRDGGVPVGAGLAVEQHGGDAAKALPHQAGQAGEDDEGEQLPQKRQAGRGLALGELGGLGGAQGGGAQREIARREAGLRPPAQEGQEQDAGADVLGQHGGQPRPRDAHMEHEDEHGVAEDVEHPARDQPHHGKGGVALVAQDVVHHAAGDHGRRRQQDVGGVAARVGQDGAGGAEQAAQRGEEHKAQRADGGARQQRGVERRGGELPRAAGVFGPKLAADVGAGAVAEHEPDGLQNGHQAEHHAGGAGGTGADLADEGGIDDVVDVGDQHADGGGQAKLDDKAGDGLLRHFVVLVGIARMGKQGHGRCGPSFLIIKWALLIITHRPAPCQALARRRGGGYTEKKPSGGNGQCS